MFYHFQFISSCNIDNRFSRLVGFINNSSTPLVNNSILDSKLAEPVIRIILQIDEIFRISVVFINIILNAVQAIEKNNGKISIRVAQENDFIKIEIENTGPNIPEKDLDIIFKPLYTTKMEGTGLGLSGCKNIIQSHMGTITVSNDPVKFTMKIPKSF